LDKSNSTNPDEKKRGPIHLLVVCQQISPAKSRAGSNHPLKHHGFQRHHNLVQNGAVQCRGFLVVEISKDKIVQGSTADDLSTLGFAHANPQADEPGLGSEVSHQILHAIVASRTTSVPQPHRSERNVDVVVKSDQSLEGRPQSLCVDECAPRTPAVIDEAPGAAQDDPSNDFRRRKVFNGTGDKLIRGRSIGRPDTEVSHDAVTEPSVMIGDGARKFACFAPGPGRVGSASAPPPNTVVKSHEAHIVPGLRKLGRRIPQPKDHPGRDTALPAVVPRLVGQRHYYVVRPFANRSSHRASAA
jgi:hypothetical protein